MECLHFIGYTRPEFTELVEINIECITSHSIVPGYNKPTKCVVE